MENFESFLCTELAFQKKENIFINFEKNIVVKFIEISHKGILEKEIWEKEKFEKQKKIAIFESDWLYKKAIIKSRLKAILGFANIIHGRHTIVKRIDQFTANNFLEENHLLGGTSAKYKYGLYVKKTSQMVAVATFSGTRKMTYDSLETKSIELIRFANLLETRVYGGLDKLMQYAVKDLAVNDIMTYVDTSWGGGASFEKIGFEAQIPSKKINLYFDLLTKKPQKLLDNNVNLLKMESFETIKYKLKCAEIGLK